MVHDDVPKGQSQDRQGRYTASTCEADEDVQFLGIQGCVCPFEVACFTLGGGGGCLGDLIVLTEHSFLDTKVVYRRYASLFFVCGISAVDNELATLEIVHRYVEVLDRYFGNVSPPLLSLTISTKIQPSISLAGV